MGLFRPFTPLNIKPILTRPAHACMEWRAHHRGERWNGR